MSRNDDGEMDEMMMSKMIRAHWDKGGGRFAEGGKGETGRLAIGNSEERLR
ncbi:hypothetical protein ZHAS_00004021 [Anopheles sinensis]|uniref:Uncharacterized protein n=1 Tax=Anopheles sinensis TaxID=74873 RepID=A0A084VFW4_ANOSI|nr:hypothetical protein ZHAS_00004021 [Anopheles sinensis]